MSQQQYDLTPAEQSACEGLKRIILDSESEEGLTLVYEEYSKQLFSRDIPNFIRGLEEKLRPSTFEQIFENCTPAFTITKKNETLKVEYPDLNLEKLEPSITFPNVDPMMYVVLGDRYLAQRDFVSAANAYAQVPFNARLPKEILNRVQTTRFTLITYGLLSFVNQKIRAMEEKYKQERAIIKKAALFQPNLLSNPSYRNYILCKERILSHLRELEASKDIYSQQLSFQ